MNYEVAIPSFNRPKIIKEKTLKLLGRLGIPNNSIKLFVGSVEQKKLYEKELGTSYVIIVTFSKGIMEKRNFLETYYREQTVFDRVLYCDDDLEDILILNKKNPKVCDSIDQERFDSYISQIFDFTEYHGLSIFGVSSLHNPFYMSYNTTRNLKYISGAFKGQIIRRDRHEIHSTISHFEDYQFSCEYFLRDGGVVRSNHISIKTEYFIETGGICESMGGLAARKASMIPNSQYMLERYGPMVKVVDKKWGPELKLNWRFIADVSDSEDE